MTLATLVRPGRTRLPFGARFLATSLTLLALLTFGANAWAQVTYTWNGGGGAWTNAANWTPTRTTPATNDVLVFSDGGTYTVTAVPTQKIGQLSVSNNTNVTLDSGNLKTLVEVTGGAGTDVSVASGAALNISNTNAAVANTFTLLLDTGVTAAINGSSTWAAATLNTPDSLKALSASAVTIGSGGVVTQGANLTGSLFNGSAANAIQFGAGSTFDQKTGANPFAQAQFAPTNLYIYEVASGTPSFSGRVYGNFEYNAASGATVTGGTAMTIFNITIDQGVFHFGMTGVSGHAIKGNILVKPGASFIADPASAATINFNGTSTQTITNNGTFSTSNLETWNLNNANGLSLGSNITIGSATAGGGITIASGKIATGANTLTIASGASLTGAASGTGWVNGKLQRTIPISAGSGTLTYDIGDASNYTPVNFATSTGATPIVLTASTTPSQHPNISTSGIDQTKDIKRYYTLTTSNPGSFTNANLTFNWANSDNLAGNPSNYIAAKFDAPSTWTSLAAGSSPINSTSMTVNGVTGFSDFAIGEAAATYTIVASAGANGSISPSGNVSVTGGSNQSFSITPNSGYHVADVVVDGGSVGAVTSYTFNNVSANHTITASFADWTILSTATSGGSIAPSGTNHFLTGANQTYTITPDPNHHIVDVTVDNGSVGPVTSYSFTNISANHTIAASFAIDQHTITASAGANGSITPSGAVLVDHGNDQSFTIAANSCYHVADVVVDGGSVGAVTSYTFNNVTTDHTITASFAINTYAIESSAGPNGSISPNGTTPLNCGDNQTYTITPDGGYSVLEVDVDGNNVGAVTSYTFNNVQANHTITASFAAGVFHILASAGSGGAIAPSGDIAVTGGGNQTFTITPDGNHTIADVVVDGSSVGAVSSYTFTNVITDHTITASFAFITYTIDASAGPNGSITPSGTVSVNSGDNQSFTITADPHYQIGDVVVDGNSVGAVASYTFNNVTANHTIAASFVVKQWQIVSSAGANGSIAPNGVTNVDEGSDQSYTITGAPHYHVADVIVDGGSVGAVTSYTFQNVTANHTISASFTIDQFPVNVTVVGSGSVTKTPNQALYDYGTSVQLSATAGAGYHFDSWSGDATGSTNPLTITVDGTKNITATFLVDVYAWNQSGSADFQVSTNWTPTRFTPKTDDVLQFNNGATTTATNVPTQTFAQLAVTGNTNVTLQANAARTLTLGGASGTDLSVDAGSALGFTASTAANAITLALGSGTTGVVNGTVFVTGAAATPAAHRLTSPSAGALVFNSGALCDIQNGFAGNLFGTTSLNSVFFNSGSVYQQAIGSNPFGATAPSSVVQFNTGSLYRVLGPPAGGTQIVPSFSGRTYANFESNIGANSIVSSGASDLNIDALTVTSGTLSLGMTGNFFIHGDLTVAAAGTLNFNPASGTPVVTLQGTGPQTVTVNGTLGETSNETIAINNSNGVSLGSNVTIPAGLQFLHGNLTTGANTLAIAAAGSITGAGSSTGWVVGNLQRNVPTSGARLFDVGNAALYSPMSLTFHGLLAAFDLVGRADTPDHPNLASSNIDPNHSVNRYWTLTPAAATPGFTDYTAAFRFNNPADLDAGDNTANFVVDRYDGTWHTTTTGVRTATSTQATGLNAFGAFAIGDLVASTTTLTSDVNPSTCGQKVNLTATVAPAGATGTVTFFDGATSLGTSPVDASGHATLSVTSLGGGAHSLTAQYSGDGTYGPSTSAPYTQTVNGNATTTSVAGSPNPSVCGQKVTITATVTPAGGTGTVEFFDGATSLGTAPVDGTGHASVSTVLGVGSHSLTGNYSGDGCYLASNSPAKAQTVNKATPTLSVTSDVNPSTYGSKVNFTASVNPGATGTFTFRDSSTVLGTAPVDANGNATLSVSNLRAGAHTNVNVKYSGDGCFAAGTSPGYTQQVDQVTSSTVLQQDSKTTNFGDDVTLTATVSPSGLPAAPAGHMFFYDGANLIGSSNVVNGVATLHVSNLLPGKHDLSAVYQGDQNYTSSTSNIVSHVVNATPTTTTLATDANNVKLGSKVNLTATVSPAGATGTVEFFDGANSLGTAPVDGSGNATLSVTTLTAGDHQLTANYSGDIVYAPSTSNTVTETIIGGPTATVVFPNGGENEIVGTTVKLIWTSDGPQSIPTASLYVSRDNGATYETIATDVPNNGSYVWTVDPPGTNTGVDPVYSALFKVVVKDVSDLTGQDVSDAPFSIYDGAVSAVVTQLDAEPADLGVTIKWQLRSHNVFTTIGLQRSTSEVGPWNSVAADAQQQGEFTVVTDKSAEAGKTYWYRLVGTTNTGATATFGPVKGISGAPKEFALSSVWPNPTKGAIKANFAIARSADIRLSVIDVQGREVSVLARGTYAAGRYQVSWDGRNDHGPVGAGLYFLRLQTPDKKFVQRIVIAN